MFDSSTHPAVLFLSTKDELVRFLRGLRPSINAAIAAAVRLEIDTYHHQMRIWRREMSAEEWQRLRVVVVEAPQARRADTAVATAFFDDPGRLDRDILGDAAIAYLDTLSLE